MELPLEVVTPILGGGTRMRSVDVFDPIRGASIRGQLRFWWRALLDEVPSTLDALVKKEEALFGGVSGSDGPMKSAVRISVGNVSRVEEDTEDVTWRDPLFYVLWPAASQRGTGAPAAPRLRSGLRFTLRVSAPTVEAPAIKRALKAWVLFGGYGARTRRGLGALTVIGDDRSRWLPGDATVQAVAAHLGVALGRQHSGVPSDMARLNGASLALGPPSSNAESVLLTAVKWLSEFRQGAPASGPLHSHDPRYARDRGERQRPSRSNWPEADKVRRLVPGRWSHPARYLDDPAWPRAGFGLPIQTQWQTNGRRPGDRYTEPPRFVIQWRDRSQQPDRHGAPEKLMDRLASPLVIGPMPLANGRFAPFALWLHRGFPQHGEVVAVVEGRGAMGPAPFDKLLGRGDTALFDPLGPAQKEPPGYRLRSAFMTWLTAEKRLKEVAP